MQHTQQGIRTTSTVATTTRADAAVTYKEVTNLRGNKWSTSTAAHAASQLGTDV